MPPYDACAFHEAARLAATICRPRADCACDFNKITFGVDRESMEILHGRDLADAILSLFAKPGRLRCAVAFWGPSLAKLAFDRKAEVVLDISMGGTSRNALKAFGLRKKKLPNAKSRVTVLDKLHAKMFIGEQVAIIGSANASRNALGADGRVPALREAGVVIDRIDDPLAYARLEQIFDEYRELSRPIVPEDLDRAVRAPTNPAARDYSTSIKPTTLSLFCSVLAQPEKFKDSSYIFADDEIDKPELQKAKKAYVEKFSELPKESGRHHICTSENNDDVDEVLRGKRNIVTFWFSTYAGLYAYYDIVRIEHGKRSVSYFGRQSWTKVRLDLGITALTKDDAWQKDMHSADSIAGSSKQAVSERFVAMTSDELFEWLEREGRNKV